MENLDSKNKLEVKNNKKAIVSMITASVSFAMMAVMVKLSGGGIPLFQQVFFRNLIMVIFAMLSLASSKTSIYVAVENRLSLMLRSLFGFGGVICVFFANNHLPLADAQILQKLNPFFVIIFAILILKEKVTWQRIMAVIFGFLGAVIVINPSGDFGSIFANLVGVASGFFGGIAYVMVGKMAGKVKGMVIIFYFSLFSTIVSAVPMLLNFVIPTTKEWLYLILIGVFAAGGQYFITKAYTIAGASKVALFDYTGVVISPILSVLIFSDSIELSTLIGMIVIILSGYWSSRLR